jgi:hypothetical protein
MASVGFHRRAFAASLQNIGIVLVIKKGGKDLLDNTA